jgi:hypothetical protein
MWESIFKPTLNNGKIKVFNILIFTFLDSRMYDKRLRTEQQETFHEFRRILISKCTQFSSVSVVVKHLNSATPSKKMFPTFILCSCPDVP